MPAIGGQIDNLGAFQRHILGCADLDVLRIRLVVLSEAAIIEIESDPIFHADQHDSGGLAHHGDHFSAILSPSASAAGRARARNGRRRRPSAASLLTVLSRDHAGSLTEIRLG